MLYGEIDKKIVKLPWHHTFECSGLVIAIDTVIVIVLVIVVVGKCLEAPRIALHLQIHFDQPRAERGNLPIKKENWAKTSQFCSERLLHIFNFVTCVEIKITFTFYFHQRKLQFESKAADEQLLGKVAPEKQIPAGFFFGRERETKVVVCLKIANK